MKSVAAALLLGLPLAWATLPQSEDPQGVTVRVVKYDGLKETIRKHRGQVLLVDFWGNF